MARQMDNSFLAISRPVPLLPYGLFGGGLLVLTLAGLLISFSAGQWALFTLLALVSVGLAVFAGVILARIRTLSLSRQNRLVECEDTASEIQREALGIEVRELSHDLGIGDEQIGELQSAYLVAEDLALRQIQQEEGVPVLRHLAIAGCPFDAVIFKSHAVVCCDVTFLVVPELRKDKIDSMLKKIGTVKHYFEQRNLGLKLRLMPILVTQLSAEDSELLRRELTAKRFPETPVDIDIRTLDFEALQRIYFTE
jgi:hypothetical protein